MDRGVRSNEAWDTPRDVRPFRSSYPLLTFAADTTGSLQLDVDAVLYLIDGESDADSIALSVKTDFS